MLGWQVCVAARSHCVCVSAAAEISGEMLALSRELCSAADGLNSLGVHLCRGRGGCDAHGGFGGHGTPRYLTGLHWASYACTHRELNMAGPVCHERQGRLALYLQTLAWADAVGWAQLRCPSWTADPSRRVGLARHAWADVAVPIPATNPCQGCQQRRPCDLGLLPGASHRRTSGPRRQGPGQQQQQRCILRPGQRKAAGHCFWMGRQWRREWPRRLGQ